MFYWVLYHRNNELANTYIKQFPLFLVQDRSLRMLSSFFALMLFPQMLFGPASSLILLVPITTFFFKQRFFVFILQVSLHRASPYGHAICALASLCRLDCDTVFPSTVPVFTLLERYRPLSVLIVNFPWNSQLCLCHETLEY